MSLSIAIFRHALEPWTSLHITWKSYMWEPKYLKQLSWALNWLHSVSSLVLRECVNCVYILIQPIIHRYHVNNNTLISWVCVTLCLLHALQAPSLAKIKLSISKKLVWQSLLLCAAREEEKLCPDPILWTLWDHHNITSKIQCGKCIRRQGLICFCFFSKEFSRC